MGGEKFDITEVWRSYRLNDRLFVLETRVFQRDGCLNYPLIPKTPADLVNQRNFEGQKPSGKWIRKIRGVSQYDWTPPLLDPGSNSTRMIGPPRSNHPKVPWTPPWKNGPPFESKFAYYPWPHGPRSPSQSIKLYLDTECKVFTLLKPEHI